LFSNPCLRYPYAYGARYVLHGAISKDEGQTWQGFREVARDPARNDPPDLHGDYGVSYTYPTLTADGQVLFSNWVEQGSVRRFRLLDPAWLLETTHAWDGGKDLEEWLIFGSRGVELQSDPGQSDGRVLAIRKADREWPAGAVWNFPVGAQGRLSVELKLQPQFGGLLIGLTDHASPPWDMEDEFCNVFNLPISAAGALLSDSRLTPERWHKLELAWDTNARECRVSIDGKSAASVQDNRRSPGVFYLRLRSTATDPDGGLLVRAVRADVSADGRGAEASR
jgi:hypothetical protein